MNPVDQRRLLRFEGFRRGDVRLDHELFDELVRFEALGDHHARHKPAFVEDDLALRQVEIEGPRRSRASLSRK